MGNTVKRVYIVYALILAFLCGLVFLVYGYAVHGDEWVTKRVNNHLYTNRQLTTAGSVLDRNGKVLVESDDDGRSFNSDLTVRKATLHAVGDTQGYIATGVQSIYRSYMIGYDFINGVYKAVRDGTGNDITLTIDADICRTAYNALGYNNGTVGVYNYKTGEVICMVSKPTYDPENKPADIDSDTSGKYDGIYLNRLLSGVFTPGSVFKTVVAICALENMDDINERDFKCTGKYTTKDGTVICNATHGKLTFEKAYNRSCNSVFAQLANELGKKKLTATAEDLGFNSSLSACGVSLAKSMFNVSKADKNELGWAGIGQHTVLANPCHLLMITGAVANGGNAVTPKIVKNSTSSKLLELLGDISPLSQISIDTKIASQMQKMMRSTVKNYYGDGRFPGLEMCGKTGTAEVDGERPHAWFMGFSQKEDFPYAIVVMVENGGSASSVAIPVANKVMQALD